MSFFNRYKGFIDTSAYDVFARDTCARPHPHPDILRASVPRENVGAEMLCAEVPCHGYKGVPVVMNIAEELRSTP